MPTKQIIFMILAFTGILGGTSGFISIMPVYLVSTFGVNVSIASALIGSTRIPAPVGQLISGKLSDRYGRRPMDRIRKYVELIRKILSGEIFDHNGSFFKLSSGHLGFVPPSTQIPIYLAARSPSMTRLAGEVADGLLLFLTPPKWIISRVKDQLEEGAERADRSSEDIDIAAWVPCYVTDNDDRADYIAKRSIAQYSQNLSLNRLLGRLGHSDSMNAVKCALENEGLEKAIKLMPDELVHTLVLTGDRDDIAKGLKEYVSAGVKLPILMPMCFDDGKSQIERIISIIDHIRIT